MSVCKRATVYFESSLHKALQLRAAQTEQSISDLVSAAVRRSLAEDLTDLAAFDARAKEPNLDFKGPLRNLKRHG